MELQLMNPDEPGPQATQVAWSQNGRTLGLACSPGPSTWELGTQRISSVTAHPDFVGAVDWLPQAGELVAGTSAGEILRVSAYRQRVTQKVNVLPGEVMSVAVSPDGGHVAACCNAGSLWLGRTTDFTTDTTITAHRGVARAVAWSPSGHVATCGSDGAVRVWTTSGEAVGELTDHQSPVISSVAYSPDGQLLGSCSNDRTVRLWHVAEQRYERIFDRFDRWWIWDFVFAPDGTLLATLGQDQAVAIWRLEDGALLARKQVGIIASHLTWHPHEPLIAISGPGMDVQLLQVHGASTDATLPLPPRSVAASPPQADPGPQSPREHLHQADLFIVTNQLEAALPHLEIAAEAGLVSAMSLAGSVAEDLGQTDLAKQWHTRAAAAGHPTSMFALGRFAFVDGDLDEAEQWFAKAPAKTSGEHSGYALLIQIAEQRGDPGTARDWIARGVADDDPVALVKHALQLSENGSSPEQALPFAKRAADKKHPAGLFLMGMYCEQLGRVAEAVDWLKKAIGAGHPTAQAQLDRIEGLYSGG